MPATQPSLTKPTRRNSPRHTRFRKKQAAKHLDRLHKSGKQLPAYSPRSKPEEPSAAPTTSLPPPEPPPFISDDQLLASYEKSIVRISRLIAAKYHLRDEDAEDMAQAARIDLYRCAQDKRHIGAWCRTLINNEMRNALVKIRRLKDVFIPIDPAWWEPSKDSGTESQGTSPIDVLHDVTEPVDATLARDQLAHSLLSSLPVENRLVLTLYLGLVPGEPAIKDFSRLSKLSMVRECRLQNVIDSSLAKLRRLAGTKDQCPL